MTARLATPADNALLRSIVEHPDLVPFNSEPGAKFDPALFTEHPTNFGVIVPGGCFLANCTERFSYDIHTNMLPKARGAAAMRAAREALHFAFTCTDAEVLTTKVADTNPAAAWFAHLMGFRDTFRRAGAFKTLLTGPVALQYMRLDIDDWIVKSDTCSEFGEAFHDALGDDVTHTHDAVHDAYVGAAVAMIDNHRANKAERVYGRWARATGYQPFVIESHTPLTVNIGTHRLTADGARFTAEKITCPQP